MNYIKLLWELAALKKNEVKTRTQIQDQAQRKLRGLLSFAYDRSPYYKHVFEQMGLNAETVKTAPLSAFPTLDKHTLLKRFDELITVPGVKQESLRRFDADDSQHGKLFQEKYHIVHSSGSTGKPGYFLYDDTAWNTMLLGIIRGALWGMSMGEILKFLAQGPRIAYIASTDGRYGGAMAVGDGIDGLRAQQLHLDIKTPLAQWVTQLQAFHPNIVIGYPSAIKILAELVEHGELKIALIRAISCGEPLSPNLRQYLEAVFHTPIVNFYGASESLALGVETDPAAGMILFDDLNMIEETEGGIYLTCLYNFAQPLIRYRISDHLHLDVPDNTCRYPFTKAVGLVGRNEDLLWFTDSDGNREFLHPLAVEGFCIEGLLDYQFQQSGVDAFEMLAETTVEANKEVIYAEMHRQMGGILQEKGLDYVQFHVTFVDKILPDPLTGKKPLILQATHRKGAIAV